MLPPINEEEGLNVTINTTEDCNLRCKYCYESNKRNRSIPIEYCKKFIDILLQDIKDWNDRTLLLRKQKINI